MAYDPDIRPKETAPVKKKPQTRSKEENGLENEAAQIQQALLAPDNSNKVSEDQIMEKVEEMLKTLRNEFIEGFIGRESLDQCEKGLLAKIADVERHMDMYKEDLSVV